MFFETCEGETEALFDSTQVPRNYYSDTNQVHSKNVC